MPSPPNQNHGVQESPTQALSLGATPDVVGRDAAAIPNLSLRRGTEEGRGQGSPGPTRTQSPPTSLTSNHSGKHSVNGCSLGEGQTAHLYRFQSTFAWIS